MTRRALHDLTAACACALLLVAAPATAAPDTNVDRARAHFKQGEAYFKAGTFDLAIREYQAAYELVPKPQLLFNIGLAYEQLGERERAIEFLERYLAAEPDGAAAEEARARVIALERALAEDRQRTEALARASQLADEARAQAAAGDADAAAASFERAFELSADPEHLFDRAEVQAAAAQSQQAITSFERYLAAAPTGVRRTRARARIAELERQLALTRFDDQRGGGGGDGSGDDRQPRPTSRRWLWFAGAAAAVTAAIALDTLPDYASNNELEAVDFVPIGLYAAGLGFAIAGVF